jgi:ubiquinone biosynthesis protein Coq4
MKLSRKLLRNILTVVENPERTDKIFDVITSPEILNQVSLNMLMSRMQEDKNVVAMMRERYKKPWRVAELAEYPKGSLGYTYARHMLDRNLDVDFYPQVEGESEEAYILTRLRHVHDLWHTITGFDTTVADEVGLQAFGQAQMNVRTPGVIMSMLMLHATFFTPEKLYETTTALARGWAMGMACKPICGERFEEFWERDLNEYRQALGIASFFA